MPHLPIGSTNEVILLEVLMATPTRTTLTKSLLLNISSLSKIRGATSSSKCTRSHRHNKDTSRSQENLLPTSRRNPRLKFKRKSQSTINFGTRKIPLTRRDLKRIKSRKEDTQKT